MAANTTACITEKNAFSASVRVGPVRWDQAHLAVAWAADPGMRDTLSVNTGTRTAVTPTVQKQQGLGAPGRGGAAS